MSNKELKNTIINIIKAIDLNYLIAINKRENNFMKLFHGSIEKDNILWNNNYCIIPYDYINACSMINQFITTYSDKIIKMNITNNDIIHPINSNTIIYFPISININKIRKEYPNIVESYRY